MSEAAWTDDPLDSSRGDTLGRRPYAHRAAELIRGTHSFDSSIVFGLSGPWGSGKTSLINMIVEHLTAQSNWAIARFTPWATSDITGLLEEFYSSLSQSLPKKKGRQVRRALGVAARVAAPAANLIPIAGASAAEAGRIVADRLTKTPPWDLAFSEASQELRKLETPILVVVDDIDRLHVDELMTLLKVVRLLGRFPGVQYLLAYDDETLFRTLSSTSTVSANDGSAERYMEKIVQYPLLVPPLLHHQQLSRLNDGIAQVARRTDSGEDRLSALVDCFVALLRTPRAIDRYVAQLRHHLPMVPPDEVDDADVQLLTLLRVSFPSLFTALPRYRRQLLDGHTGEMERGGPSVNFVRFQLDPLLSLVPDMHRDVVEQLLVSLFPKTKDERKFAVYGSHTGRGVANEKYFDRYFAMGIPAHDVSDAAVRAATRAASQGDGAALSTLLQDEDRERQLLVLSKATNDDNQPAIDSERLQLALVVADLVNQAPDEDGSPFGTREELLGWLSRQIADLDPDTPAQRIVDLLQTLSSGALRTRAWRRVEYALERRPSDRLPKWSTEVAESLASEAVSHFVEHLLQADSAPTGSQVGYELHFALRHGRASELRAKVQELLTSEKIDLSVLASRLVSAHTIVGIRPNWELSTDFDQETYDLIAPPGDNPWYSESREEVDTHDLSWANRRRFVVGRVSPPSATEGTPQEE
ncbi:KAP family NTPase [Blastococcus sp. URHD0036]|uniref:KAP family NTPase n=1 Tax=Blastococcus sp. URHD0036 TaxID=1380356 RepID=UPI000A6F38A9|nr:KAP family NTPase [Blastococcus sp. URHD0036]